MSKTNQEQKEKWYWVKIDGEWSPAVYDPRSSGGWTNLDTWEDFDGDVVAWQDATGARDGALCGTVRPKI